MRTMILMMPVSADGFTGGPERELDWHKADDEISMFCASQLTGAERAIAAPNGGSC